MRTSMKKLSMTSRVVVVLSIIISSFIPHTIFAQTSENLDFVYGTNHYNGATYSSAFIPSSVDTQYLLADHTSIVAARFTQVYYWQVTNEYKADWDSKNIVVDGTLEVLKSNKLVQSIDLSEYIIQYDGNNKINTSRLYLGGEAIAARTNYETLQAKYRDDLHSYYQLLNNYTALYQAAFAELQKGNITEDQLPQSPTPLADFSLFSTDVLYGFPVTLPVGEYIIRLKLSDQSIQQGSIKKLVVFKDLGDGIGYSIAGEARWNLPEDTLSDSEVIYGLKGGIYYIQPVYQKLYNERYYKRMNNPQDKTARIDRTIWVPFHSAENVKMDVFEHRGKQNSLFRTILCSTDPG